MQFPRLVLVSARLAAYEGLVSRPFVGERRGPDFPVPWVAVALGHQRGRWLLARRGGKDETAIDALVQAAEDATYAMPFSWLAAETVGVLRQRPQTLRAVGDASVSPFTFATAGDGLDDLSSDLVLSAPPLRDLKGLMDPGALLAIVPKRGWLMVIPDDGNVPEMERLSGAAHGIFERGGDDALSPFVFRVANGRVIGMLDVAPGGVSLWAAKQEHVHWYLPATPAVAPTHDLDDFEQAIVHRVAAKPDNWHALAVSLSGLEPGRNFMEVLRDLERRGYLVSEPRDGGMDRWSAAPAVACWAAEQELPPGPLAMHELARLAAALAAGGMAAIQACTALLAAPDGEARLEPVLWQALAVDERCAESMSVAVAMLPRDRRPLALWSMMTDPRLAVRVGLLRSWISVDARPSPLVGLVEDRAIDDVLRVAMTDEAPEVRQLAAALAASARRAPWLAGELQRLAVDPEPQVRAWAVHAQRG